MRRAVCVVAVAGLLVLAGCSTGIGDAGNGSDPASDGNGDLEIITSTPDRATRRSSSRRRTRRS